MVDRGIIACPAKINLYLRVMGKREDGYHELETVFQTIDLADTLQWHPEGSWRFTVLGGPDYGDQELVYRAALAYASKTGIPLRGHAQLRKRIPAGAGLGGGSSDAAGMLQLLNREYGALRLEELHEVALSIGSDVPFFLIGGRQWGRGRGEILAPCPWRLAHDGGFLLLPDFPLSTAAVFKTLKALPMSSKGEESLPNKAVLGSNDLFTPACQVEPRLKPLAQAVRSAAAPEPVFMSGAGSALVWLTNRENMPPGLLPALNQNKVTPLRFRFTP